MSEASAASEVAAVPAEGDGSPPGPLQPYMLSVDRLTAHPANVREDLDLTPQFVASVAESGVRIPLLVTGDDPGGYRVIEGHRRLAAALKAGLREAPCVFDSSRAGDQAGQFLDMVVANSGAYRKNLTPAEEVAALFAAHEAGATKTRIRKVTGRKGEEIKTALQAGGISAGTRAQMAGVASQLTLDQLALVAEFDGDPEAVAKILESLRHGFSVEYVAERIRQDRAEAAEHERLRDELEAAGVTITSGLPEGAAKLMSLTHDGEDLTPEAHASCPGRGAFFPSWGLLHPVHYCANPTDHGHAYRHPFMAPPAQNQDSQAPPSPLPDAQDNTPPDPDRRLVIEGNKAWTAAAEVRKRWLQQLLARRSAPAEVARFVAGQLLTMPEPLRLGLAAAHLKPLFAEMTGTDAAKAVEGCGTCQPSRLPLLMLAPLAVAYEGEMCGADASRRSTWRTDRYSPCPPADAGRYLAFLASLGYRLSVIEQAVADGVPYTGDNVADPDPAGSANSIADETRETKAEGEGARSPGDGEEGGPVEAV